MAKKKTKFSQFFGKTVAAEKKEKIVKEVFPLTHSHYEFSHTGDSVILRNKVNKDEFILTSGGLLLIRSIRETTNIDVKALLDVLEGLGVEFE